MRTYYVYKITNTVNGKVYVGQHRKKEGEDPRSFEYAGSGYVLRKAYAKYGMENFTKEVLVEDIETKELVNDAEIYYIWQFQSTKKEYGYNVTRGGEGGHVEGVRLSRAHREALSRCKVGNKNRAKAVIRLNDMRVFESAREARRESGLKTRGNGVTVEACCCHLRTDIEGFCFEWYDPSKPPSFYEKRLRAIPSEKEKRDAEKFKRVRIVEKSTQKTWKSKASFTRDHGLKTYYEAEKLLRSGTYEVSRVT